MGKRKQAAGNGEPRGRMLGEAVLPLEDEPGRRKLSGPENQTAPRAGRTGGLGTRAERPSEGKQRQIADRQPEPGRKSKAPSATDRAEKLPQPARDSTN